MLRLHQLELSLDDAATFDPSVSYTHLDVYKRQIPAGTYRLKAQATETDVDRIAAGDEMTVSFDELDLPPVTATVTAVDPLGDGGEETSRFAVWLDFEAPDGVLPGMHATVQGGPSA